MPGRKCGLSSSRSVIYKCIPAAMQGDAMHNSLSRAVYVSMAVTVPMTRMPWSASAIVLKGLAPAQAGLRSDLLLKLGQEQICY